jgi:hypothetical protein
MTGVLQASLTGGELSPGLWGRVDIGRYSTCLETAINVLIQPNGGIKNRPGFEYLGDVKDESSVVRIIPFIFSEGDSLILELGPNYLRIWDDGDLVIKTPGTTPWSAMTSYQSYGLVVPHNGVNYYNMINPNLGYDPELYPAYWHALENVGSVCIVELYTPYAAADLAELSFVQSGDTIYFAHKWTTPMVLQRIASSSWSLVELPFKNGPFSVLNTNTTNLMTISATTGTITINANGGTFDDDNIQQLIYIEAKNYLTPWQVATAVSAGEIRRSDGKYYEAKNSATTGTLKPVHNSGEWSDGGAVWEYLHSGFGIARITAVAPGGASATATVISQFPVDLVTNGSDFWSWCDWWAGDNPSSVTIHQQRLVFGGSPSFPETIWFSKTSDYVDFGTSAPVVDDDSISVTLAANTVQSIRGLISMNTLMVLTNGGAWIIGTGDADALTPSNIGSKLQTWRGSARIDPLGIGKSALYVQDKGQIIRDLAFDNQTGTAAAYDLTMLASHLFEGFQVIDWAWMETPIQTLWVVRSDGVLLSCVYVREQEILGWAQHDLDGFVKSVSVIPEGNEHVLYICIQRYLNGTWRQYIERLHTRFVNDITEAFFVDSGLMFENTFSSTAFTITLSGGTNYDENETFTATATLPIFSYPALTDVGDYLGYTLSDGEVIRLEIVGLTSAYVATVRPNLTVPSSLLVPGAISGDSLLWYRDTYSIPHLTGEEVAILADGMVRDPQTVDQDGYLILDPPANKVSVGLAYNSDLKTLDPALGTPETPMDKRKNITQVRFMVRESRGFKAGRDFDTLYEARTRNLDVYDNPPALFTGIADISIACSWEPKGVICLRQDEPLPINWIAIIPELQVGGK